MSVDTPATATLEERVTRLEDLAAIERIWHRYLLAVDRRDVDDYGDLFTEDAVVRLDELGDRLGGGGEFSGRDEIVARRANSVFPAADSANSGHFGTTFIVHHQDSSLGTASAYFLSFTLDTHISAGTYAMSFRRDPDAWRIRSLRVTVTYRADFFGADVWSSPIRAALSAARIEGLQRHL